MKSSRPLSIFLSLIVLFCSLVVPVSAADSDVSGSLVSSDLSYWTTSADCSIDKWGGYQGIQITESEISDFFIGYALDKTTIKSGDSYSITFKMPSYNSIKARFGSTSDVYYAQLDKGDFYVGLAYMDSDGTPVFYEGLFCFSFFYC